ncbi:MAG: DUF1974 domain-containing protein [Gallionella sp.]|nr:DUF1974 domain-containing protein [Gallionella sp.]
MTILMIIVALLIFVTLAFFRASVASWALAMLLAVFFIFVQSRISDDMLMMIGGGVGAFFVVLLLPALRRKLISTPLLNHIRRLLPDSLDTELPNTRKDTWEQALFNGQPDWNAWLALPKASLTPAERSFLNQEVEQLCALQVAGEVLTPKAQDFLESNGFLSLGVATEAGGLGFSVYAQSQIVSKIVAIHRDVATMLVDQSDLLRAAAYVGQMKHAIETTFQHIQQAEPIGRERQLAHLAAQGYLIDSAQQITALAQDQGAASNVMLAIMRFYASARARDALHDAIDIQHEDADLNTILVASLPSQIRSGQIFAQGVLAAHVYAAKELSAAQHQNSYLAQLKFDAAFREHVRFVLSHAARSWVFGLTGGFGMIVPGGIQTTRYYQRLTRFSAAFALCTDATLAVAGRTAKQHEALFARLGEVFGLLYLCAATLKRFEDDNRPKEDLPKLEWAIQHALYQIQQTLLDLLQNMPNGLVRMMLRGLVFPLGARLTPPLDTLGKKVLQSYRVE